ncbi:membrane cofactor protein-like isoform X2 [Parambassis ranga]|uniref:Membrane cofactor protein-like isoform X2 n=1 Tax=Parambassis ranga TaxID=210632 RepID=A0A6P7IL44_9TELE|nr:membrane cofactor protein-like isoform X2 [Parambassis ranga]
MGVPVFLLLGILGLVVTAKAQSCSKPALGPNMNLHNDYILSQTFPDGLRVSLSCVVGYQPAAGSIYITCTAGTWSPVQLICEKRPCGPAGEISNGHIEYPDGSDFGAKAVVVCDPGHTLVGNKEIRCGAQGWMGRLPTCEEVSCEPPPQIENGSFRPDNEVYRYAEAVSYTCMPDYILSGLKTISCSEDGTFKPAPPKCVKVNCPDVEVENADWLSGSRPPHGYKATMTFKCRRDYVMKGSATITCGANSSWEPAVPKCEKMPPPPTAAPTTTTTTTTTTTPRTSKRPTGSGTDDKESGAGDSSTGFLLKVILAPVAVILGLVAVAVIIKKMKGKRSCPVSPALLAAKPAA